MTTDQIAAEVQAGQADRLELWEAVRRFAYGRAYRWSRAVRGRGGAELEDLVQASFLALLEALETWDPEAGAFLTLYALKLRAAFTETTGQRTQRDKLDPLEGALSLEAPLTDSESGEVFTLVDVLADPAAEAPFVDVEERDRRDRLHRDMCAALGTLPEPQRAAVVGYFLHGQRTDAKDRNAALRALRNPRVSIRLRAYLQ